MGDVSESRKFHWGSKFVVGASATRAESESVVSRLTTTLVGNRVVVIGQLGEWENGRNHCRVCSVDLQKAEWTWVQTYGPHLEGHIAVLADDRVFIHGGKDTNNLLSDTDVWSVDLSLMELHRHETFGKQPTRRKGHTGVFVEENRHVVLFGGHHTTLHGEIYDELWVMNVDTMIWRRPIVKGRPPSARFGHAACLVNTHMFVYGGCAEDSLYRDCHVLHCKGQHYRWSRIRVKGLKPSRLLNCTLSFLSGKLFVFGGSESARVSQKTARRSLFCLDLGTYKWHRIRDVIVSDDGAPAEYTVTGKINATHSHSALTFADSILIIGGINRKLSEIGVLAQRKG